MSERLVITHVGHRGDGIADAADGDVFIPYTLPGETVDAEAVPGHPDRRKLLRVETPSPDRIAPFCPHFGICGGCATQHWADAPYRAWKRDLVVTALSQARIDAPVDDTDRRAWRRTAARGVACAARHQRHSRSRIFRVARAYHRADRCLPGARAVDGRNDPGRLGHRRSAFALAKAARYSGHRHDERPRCRCARLRPARHQANRRTGAHRRKARARAHHAAWRDGHAARRAQGEDRTRDCSRCRPARSCRRRKRARTRWHGSSPLMSESRRPSPICSAASARSRCALRKTRRSPRWTATKPRSRRCRTAAHAPD